MTAAERAAVIRECADHLESRFPKDRVTKKHVVQSLRSLAEKKR